MQYQTWKQRAFIAFANGFECYDIAVYAAIQSYIAIHFFPENSFGAYAVILSWLPLILRYFSSPFGGLFLGYYADRKGRKAALVLSSSITGTATVIMACLPTFEQIGVWATFLFFMMQLLQAFSYGGELPTTSVYLMENSKPNERALSASFMVACNIFSIALSLMITALCVTILSDTQMHDFGWRIPLLIGAVNLYVSYSFRKNLVESSQFKANNSLKINLPLVAKLILQFAPNTMLFYANTLANKLLIQHFTSDPVLQQNLPILLNIISCVACLCTGYLIDKYGDYNKALKSCYFWMIWLAVPVYGLQAYGSWFALIISECFIITAVGISMTTTVPYLYDKVKGKNKITTIGLVLNIGIIIFGSTTPMMVDVLSGYGQAYVGLLMSFGSLLFFLSLGIEKLSERRALGVKAVS